MPAQPEKSPVERTIARSFEGEGGVGKPLSNRARKTRRSVESYLRGGNLPRYMERLREIEMGVEAERRRLERAYRALKARCGEDRHLFAARWHARVNAWSFEHLNELIREHNEWYPIERNLPMDPRTRDYVRIRGRSYRREELGPDWAFAQFPPA